MTRADLATYVSGVRGTVAVTDYGWYLRLSSYPQLDEVNFWKPSSKNRFTAPEFSPFLFKLKAPHNAICGFGYYARYSRLPDWLAWDAFSVANGCDSLSEMRGRIRTIRARMHYTGSIDDPEIGCIIVVQPTFFPEEMWIRQPDDWPARVLSHMAYDLSGGEGGRVWAECLATAAAVGRDSPGQLGVLRETEAQPRYGAPVEISPRLGQGAFRIAVTDIYSRCCAITGEHSLPALDAAHIRPYGQNGPHSPENGLLLRADVHRLFDQGYITVSPDFRAEVSGRLREDYQNGRSYYPFHGQELTLPAAAHERPGQQFLEWHRTECYRG